MKHTKIRLINCSERSVCAALRRRRQGGLYHPIKSFQKLPVHFVGQFWGPKLKNFWSRYFFPELWQIEKKKEFEHILDYV